MLELCVGPSLEILEKAYEPFGISVTGNDIDPRWKSYYPKGNWILGDATKVDCSGFDAAVFAPPLSKGCSGKREDSLSIDQVIPSYHDFLDSALPRVCVLTLPGRTLSLKEDRSQLHKLVRHLSNRHRVIEVVPLKDKVTKYVDVYYYDNNA